MPIRPHGSRRQQSDQTPLALLCTLLIVSLVVAAVNPGPQWADGGDFISRAGEGAWFAKHFYATTHPLYHLTSTLVLTVFGAAALSYLNVLLLLPIMWLVFRIAARLGARPAAAMIAAGVVPATHCVAWIATKVEVYCLNLLMILLVYGLALELRPERPAARHLLLIGLCTGLAVSVHQLSLVVLFPLYLWLLVVARARMLWVLLGGIVGTLPGLPGILNDWHEGLALPEMLGGYLFGTTTRFEGWESAMFRFDHLIADRNAVVMVLLSLFGPGAIGMLIWPRALAGRLLWLGAAANFLFAVSYGVTDRFTFFLPGAILFATLGVVELDRRLAESPRRGLTVASAVVTPMALLSLVGLASAAGWYRLPPTGSSIEHRNDAMYFFAPWIRDRSAAALIDDFGKRDRGHPVIVADLAIAGVLRSAKAQGDVRFRSRTIIDCDSARLDFDARYVTEAVLVRAHRNCERVLVAGVPVLWE